ncbi:hypothetical protein IHE44_0013873 [Lamprotornis superbus]|uniref:Uncharacterized protein n=1 Tax=Lamprotornis superbus TaxID=245042 RepID=A0A835U2P8_9PASS|nr:hypothetical protein IHE44_0013873 [Lamprotornis superbus]
MKLSALEMGQEFNVGEKRELREKILNTDENSSPSLAATEFQHNTGFKSSAILDHLKNVKKTAVKEKERCDNVSKQNKAVASEPELFASSTAETRSISSSLQMAMGPPRQCHTPVWAQATPRALCDHRFHHHQHKTSG